MGWLVGVLPFPPHAHVCPERRERICEVEEVGVRVLTYRRLVLVVSVASVASVTMVGKGCRVVVERGSGWSSCEVLFELPLLKLMLGQFGDTSFRVLVLVLTMPGIRSFRESVAWTCWL